MQEGEWRRSTETPLRRAIQEGKVRTYDMDGKDSTLDMAKVIAAKL